ncbi:MAG: tRNA pseudouridine(55) synthase TruB [Candidatus Kapabacteria bacterium]|nr:tRNA pseudouridine(55) synthase TruB [Candidatus Kapabacteria bacterium]
MILTKRNLDEFHQWFEGLNSDGGMILIDKALDWTSFDVVAKLRSLTRIKKIGHAGTLDPLATGLLIICFGKYTKKINEFQDLLKVYESKFKFGATTKSFDSEFEEENFRPTEHITLELLQSSAKDFIGQISQIPPIFSAKKVAGKSLYKYARKNQEVEIKPSLVEVYQFDILNYENCIADVFIKCSKGTYIRSLANDLGQSVGAGAYLKQLRRTAIGEFLVSDAITINEFMELLNNYKANTVESL